MLGASCSGARFAAFLLRFAFFLCVWGLNLLPNLFHQISSCFLLDPGMASSPTDHKWLTTTTALFDAVVIEDGRVEAASFLAACR